MLDTNMHSCTSRTGGGAEMMRRQLYAAVLLQTKGTITIVRIFRGLRGFEG